MQQDRFIKRNASEKTIMKIMTTKNPEESKNPYEDPFFFKGPSRTARNTKKREKSFQILENYPKWREKSWEILKNL